MFTHLHVHSEYSLLDGMCRISSLIERAREMGMDSLAITDHGAMYGAIEFYIKAKEAGIKPIVGCEVYLARNSRFDRNAQDKESYHLVLLAKNAMGYRNLIQLVTRAHLEGFYYRPRIDKEILAEFREGLVGMSACLGGELPQIIMQGRLEDAKTAALWYKENLEDFYLEIQRHPITELEKVNQVLIEMSRELDIPLVATNDAHYINQEDAAYHDLLLCIGRNTSVNDEKRFRMPGDFFYLKSPEEMAELYRDIPEAIENTGRISEMCNLELDFGRLHLPEIDLPAGKSADEYLADLCEQGLTWRYPDPSPEIRERLSYELDVIRQTQFANYFLVVWDIIRFTREQNILFGVRGSAAASIVLYCLGITGIDPIATKLVFERFLNVERKEMPDIDLDFEDERRDEVINYVSQKYGSGHVAQIITFGTLGARAALRDVGRALGMTYSDVDRVARLVPAAPGMTLERAMIENGELAAIYQGDETVRNLIESAQRVEGIARHASTHAAGVVISKEPLSQVVPLQKASRDSDQETVMTQFSMNDIARIGLLKMDFLGLANLSILGRSRNIIRERRGIDIDLAEIPMGDQKTFDLLASGETMGVFQLEGAGMRRYIKELKPTTFSDIAAMVALYRPGPMEHIPTFIKAKHGLEPIRYPHPALASILEETYGVIVYQDQVLFIVREFAGYSLGEADIFRKAMGKKIAAVMKKQHKSFITGAQKKGFSSELAEQIFGLIEPFAGYAFNKAHSVSYALIAYQTAYLKANYPTEYITALLIANSGQADKVKSAANECRRLGIIIRPPDINRSQTDFSIETDDDGQGAIRFGLTAIKNVGEGAVTFLIKEREEKGEYRSVDDLCRRADLSSVNRRTMESLIKAGALDSLGDRGSLLAGIDGIISRAQREQQLRVSGQSTMFDLWGDSVPVPQPGIELEPAQIPVEERLAWEKELMGIYLSEHPFSALLNRGMTDNTTLCGQIDATLVGEMVSVAGMVASVRYLYTRDGKPFASVVLEDLDGSVEVMVWPRVYAATKDLWLEGSMLLVEGRVKMRGDDIQLAAESVRDYQSVVNEEEKRRAIAPPVTEAIITEPKSEPELRRCLTVVLTHSEDPDADVSKLQSVLGALKEHPGKDEVRLSVSNGQRITHLALPDMTADCGQDLVKDLAELVGKENITLDGSGVGSENNA